MTHLVLVPGANHGGWWYEPLAAVLRDHGHRVDAVTLPGLDPDGPPADDANLDDHIDHLLGVLGADTDGSTEPVVLVGHSYGGSVVCGAADRRPERIRTLVFLDAFVPADGDSCWSMTNDWERRWYVDGAGHDGLTVEPLPFFDDRARPHPIGTLLQRARLTGDWRSVRERVYVAATDPGWLADSPFVPTIDRVRDDPTWRLIETPATHNLLRDGPDLLAGILLDLVD